LIGIEYANNLAVSPTADVNKMDEVGCKARPNSPLGSIGNHQVPTTADTSQWQPLGGLNFSLAFGGCKHHVASPFFHFEEIFHENCDARKCTTLLNTISLTMLKIPG